jgi:hypothetical protein
MPDICATAAIEQQPIAIAATIIRKRIVITSEKSPAKASPA